MQLLRNILSFALILWTSCSIYMMGLFFDMFYVSIPVLTVCCSFSAGFMVYLLIVSNNKTTWLISLAALGSFFAIFLLRTLGDDIPLSYIPALVTAPIFAGYFFTHYIFTRYFTTHYTSTKNFFIRDSDTPDNGTTETMKVGDGEK